MSNIPPAWIANTAYLAGARVTKVTTDGTVWESVGAGTTGNAEPTWPTVAPWTVVDGTITWGLASSFRQQFVAGIGTVITNFIAANPTLLRQFWAARPKSGTNATAPYAYLADRPETIEHRHDIRIRTITANLVLVDTVPDNLQALARADARVDGIVDALTLNFHAAGAPSITVETGTTQIPDQEPGDSLYAEVIAVSGQLTEGRD